MISNNHCIGYSLYSYIYKSLTNQIKYVTITLNKGYLYKYYYIPFTILDISNGSKPDKGGSAYDYLSPRQYIRFYNKDR